MTNPKIEKVKTAIARTKDIIADQQNKLRDLEKQKIQLENEEIVAMFRREKLNEDEFAALLRSGREAEDRAELVSDNDIRGINQ
jgi:DNA-binding transcriptional regulator YiaG